MELKVWVEGIQRIVCGVTERTTCQDVVYALAHATGKTGRFTLIERWRNNERLLAPHEHPLKVLMKWGEYSNDVHFILQRAPLEPAKPNGAAAGLTNGTSRSKGIDPLHGFTPPPPPALTDRPPKSSNVGIVKGIPQQQQQQQLVDALPSPNCSFESEKQVYYQQSGIEAKGLVYPKYEPPYGRVYRTAATNGQTPSPTNHSADLNLVYPRYEPPYGRSSRSPADDGPRAPPPYRDPPPPAAVRNYPPPPYREPPRPRGVSPSISTGNPVQVSTAAVSSLSPPRQETWTGSVPVGSNSPMRSQDYPRVSPPKHIHNGNDYQETNHSPSVKPKWPAGHDYAAARPPTPPDNPQQAQLIQLVNRQREKLDEQHETLNQLDHEIEYFEGLYQEQQNIQKRRNAQQQELAVLEEKFQSYEDELSRLGHLESEWESLSQEGEKLKDEISTTKDRLSDTETQLESQLNNIKQLRETFEEKESRLLKDLEDECDRLKGQLEAADQLQRQLQDEEKQVIDDLSLCGDTLSEKKQALEQMIQEIKEANLQSLTIAPTDDLKNLLEGNHKSGHSRRMLGSPRQLENAVPTSKNPHGVWV